jgi:hypothetical protein
LTYNAGVKSLPWQLFYIVLYPIELIPGAERPGREGDYSTQTIVQVKIGGATPPLLLLFHGVVLKQLGTGTTSPFTA